MAKVQQVGSETVNAYGTERLPASFEVVVNGRNGTVAQVGFNIRTVKNQPLYVSDMVDSADAPLVEKALTHANLKNQKSDRNNFGSPGAGNCTIFQLSEHEIGRTNDPLPPQSPEYCEKVVAFVLAHQRLA